MAYESVSKTVTDMKVNRPGTEASRNCPLKVWQSIEELRLDSEGLRAAEEF